MLRELLARARDRGFLGPGPLEVHLDHAAGFAAAAPAVPDRVADLGSGGGVPALVLAPRWAQTRFELIESSARRAAFLRSAVEALGLGDRVAIHQVRAEVAGRDPALRGGVDLVTARGFGPPAATAECGAPLLRPGGHLLVSEPPVDDPARWPAALSALGLEDEGRVGDAPGFRLLRLVRPCPERFPRRDGVPHHRPLW